MLYVSCTLYGPFEERFAGLTGGHAIVVARSDVSAYQTQPFGDGVEHVLAFDWARVVEQRAGAVIIPLAAATARCAEGSCWREHGRRVKSVGMAVDGTAVATTGVWVCSGTWVAGRVHQWGRTGRLCLYVWATARGQVPLLSGHPVQQPAWE